MKSDPDPEVYLEIFESIERVLGRFEKERKRMIAFPIKAELHARVIQHMSKSRLRQIKKIIKELDKKADFCEKVISDLEVTFQELLRADRSSK